MQIKCLHLLWKVGDGLQGLGHKRELPGRLLLRILLRQIEQIGRQNGGTKEAQENAGTDQDVAHLVRLAVLQALLPQLGKHALHLGRKVDARVEDAPAHQVKDLHQLLAIRLQTGLAGHFGRVDLQVVCRVNDAPDAVAQSLLQIAVAHQLHVELHRLGCQAVA